MDNMTKHPGGDTSFSLRWEGGGVYEKLPEDMVLERSPVHQALTASFEQADLGDLMSNMLSMP